MFVYAKNVLVFRNARDSRDLMNRNFSAASRDGACCIVVRSTDFCGFLGDVHSFGLKTMLSINQNLAKSLMTFGMSLCNLLFCNLDNLRIRTLFNPAYQHLQVSTYKSRLSMI
jgi:hypothetical protein